ncbi:TPA: aromatic acid/H+ symport family MFS transporter, partial [Pseudomonas aeruginosa]|nr:aromatic acid/H+ symport family MFS transporter [Pseudomonas aeruginosa]
LGGSLLALELPFQQNFLAFAAPGVIGALAIACIHLRPRVSAEASVDATAKKPL